MATPAAAATSTISAHVVESAAAKTVMRDSSGPAGGSCGSRRALCAKCHALSNRGPQLQETRRWRAAAALCPIGHGLGKGGTHVFLCFALSSQRLRSISLSVSFLFYSLSRSRLNFYFVYSCSCTLAWRAFFLSLLIKCIPHGYDLTDTEQS